MQNGTLTRRQFDILCSLDSHEGKITQRVLANKLCCSVGVVNDVLKQLKDDGYIKDYELTKKAFSVLEEYRVERAVFVAAGFGARMIPVTINTPKPLVRVKGKMMIETTLDALIKCGITEIYIVVGYLAEDFEKLKIKYPSITLVYNPDYNDSNNISSAIKVSKYMRNAYVLDADLYLKNPKLITKYQYSSNYLGVPVERTDDWCFFVKNKIVSGISVGGINCYSWIGLSYWTEEDGARLEKDIAYVHETPGGKEKFWDQVPLECCKDHYVVRIRECSFDDVIEIDTLAELKAIDKSYK